MMRGGRVLVVEDDRGVADLICAALTADGFDCDWVRTDAEAQRALLEPPSPVALILDVNLGPGTTGFDVARLARQKYPRVPVIFMSGAVDENSFHAFGVPNSQFMAKPFHLEELQAVLRVAIPSLGA